MPYDNQSDAPAGPASRTYRDMCSPSLPLVLLAWHEMNIDIRTHAQHTINDRTTDQLFPATTRRLPQHQLRHLALFGNLHQRLSDVTALHTDDLGPQVLREQGMLFQAAQCRLAMLGGISAELDQPDELARESEIALRLDRDGEQFGVQAMRQSPRIADHLASMWPGIEAHQYAFTRRPYFRDPMLSYVFLELLFFLLRRSSESQFT